MLHLLAQATTAAMPGGVSSPISIITVILTLAACLGGLSYLALMMMRGFWAKNGEPVVKAMFIEWQNSPERLEMQKKLMRETIDNETQRMDGIIRKEIVNQVDGLQKQILKAVEELGTSLKGETRRMHDDLTKTTSEISTKLEAKEDDAQQNRDSIINRLAKIEGVLQVLTRSRSSVSTDNFPITPPKR